MINLARFAQTSSAVLLDSPYDLKSMGLVDTKVNSTGETVKCFVQKSKVYLTVREAYKQLQFIQDSILDITFAFDRNDQVYYAWESEDGDSYLRVPITKLPIELLSDRPIEPENPYGNKLLKGCYYYNKVNKKKPPFTKTVDQQSAVMFLGDAKNPRLLLVISDTPFEIILVYTKGNAVFYREEHDHFQTERQLISSFPDYHYLKNIGYAQGALTVSFARGCKRVADTTMLDYPNVPLEGGLEDELSYGSIIASIEFDNKQDAARAGDNDELRYGSNLVSVVIDNKQNIVTAGDNDELRYGSSLVSIVFDNLSHAVTAGDNDELRYGSNITAIDVNHLPTSIYASSYYPILVQDSMGVGLTVLSGNLALGLISTSDSLQAGLTVQSGDWVVYQHLTHSAEPEALQSVLSIEDTTWTVYRHLTHTVLPESLQSGLTIEEGTWTVYRHLTNSVVPESLESSLTIISGELTNV